jgi:hypothetical protein
LISDDPTEGAVSISKLDTEAIAHLQGVCVVPMTKDACCATDVAIGDYAFSINPPLFGTVSKIIGHSFVLNTRSASKTVQRFIYKRKPNVLKCQRTAKGGYLVPASALLALRSSSVTNMSSITLLLPKSLTKEWKIDVIELTRNVADRVQIINVDVYDFKIANDTRVDQLVKIVQDCIA